MNDLHKYLIGTAAGIILCLLIWGGYTVLSGQKAQNAIPAAGTAAENRNPAAASGQSSDIFGDSDFSDPINGNIELTAEQQERLLAAQAANEGLAKKYDGETSERTPQAPVGLNDGTTTDEFGGDMLAINRGIGDRAAVQNPTERKTEEQRKQVRDLIVQGKSAVQKNQPANAFSAFENADEAMPDDKDFEAASYYDMASSLSLLSKTNANEQTAQTARDEAERYIKKSLAARDNTDARALYASILEEQRKAADTKKQQTLMAQQQTADRARQDAQTAQRRRQVVELLGQGKNAVNNRRLDGAVSAFDKAASIMPDAKQFASDSYMEMADGMLALSQGLSDPKDVDTSLDKAEVYVKRALAAQNTSGARNLYARILDARKEQERLAQQKAEAQRKEQERLAQQKAEAQRKEQERLAQQKAEAQRKEQERLAQQKAEAQRKEQERLAQQKAEAQRKEQERLAQQKAEAQRKEQERLAQQKAEAQRKEQERLAQQKAEAQRKEQERLAQQKAEAQKGQQAAPKTQAHKQVENLLAQGNAFAQRKQLNNAAMAFDRAGRIMPKDNDFAADSYRRMADSMLRLAESATDKKTTQSALGKADEYIKKSLAAKNSPDAQTLAAKIASAQEKANAAAKPQQTAPQAPSTDTQQTQAAARRPQQPQKNAAATNAQSAANTRAAAEAAKKAQAELQAQKRDVDALVQQGKKAAGAGNFSEAQSAFGKAAARMPNGDNAFAAEQYREMADSMRGLSQSAPAHKDQALKSGADYSKKSIAAKNDDAKAHFVYAQIAEEQKNTALAVQELEAARRLDPQNYLYNYELGKQYFEQKKYPQARACFEQSVKSNPQYEAAFFNLGITHKIMNATDAALTAFSKATALKPGYVRAWIETARMQDKKRNYTESITSYQKVLSLEPSNISALKEMAQVYSKMKNMKQAERYFTEALTLGDTDPVTYYNLASVQLEAGKNAGALQNAEKALAGNGSDARFLYTYALALEKNNRLQEAEDYYSRAVAADGKYGKPRINLGRIRLEAGRLDEAEQHLLAAYRAESSNFEVNMNLGKLYGLKNQYGKAIDYYANAIKIMPKDIDARQNLAAVYLSAGLKENARDTYQAILKMNAQAWDCYYELGKVYISMDNKTEAKTIFEQLLKQKPNYRYAADVRRLLVNL